MRSLQHLIREATHLAPVQPTRTVLSPYRITPIGAHIDHQGGPVLTRPIHLGTVLRFAPLPGEVHIRTLHADPNENEIRFPLNQPPQLDKGWTSYLVAAVAALSEHAPLKIGIQGGVAGSLLGAGLSSSASVILAYLQALASVNEIRLSDAELVELNRQVENDYLGLNNGVQDQTSITLGRKDRFAYVNSLNRSVEYDLDPPHMRPNVQFLLAYSGYSRELVGSGFNNRVAECREAAERLQPGATRLNDVSPDNRTESKIEALPHLLQKRARHVFGEIERVEAGRRAWRTGDWEAFGDLMNRSCRSSIELYESGSRPLVDLQSIALGTEGVYGSRFSGGGYGGCLILLTTRNGQKKIAAHLETEFLKRYPDRAGIAAVFPAQPHGPIQITERA